jgi:hypothetical protein
MSKVLSSYSIFPRLILFFFFLTTPVLNVEAAGKDNKDKKPELDMSKVSSTEVEVKKGKKIKSQVVYCYNGKAGILKSSKDKSSFKSYKDQVADLKITARSKSQLDRLDTLSKLMKAGNKACKLPGTTPVSQIPGVVQTPAPATSLPDWLSMDPYKGTFGEAEARLLYDRFAFGARKGDAELAVQEGLEKTAERLTTFKYNPNLELEVGDLACDGELESEGDEDNRVCEASGVYVPGVRYGIYRRILKSESPFFEKLAFFLHDERMAGGLTARITQQEEFVIMPHINMIRKAATSGDYKQFMRDWNNDDLGHRLWLDGGVNNGFSPNQNYAREFWELGTIGPADSNGKANYDDQDIIESSKAFSGLWNSFHAVGPKVIFHGTPYEKTVENDEDVLNATFAHPRTAIHLAEDIWKEFINTKSEPAAIEKLAEIIRANNYNLIPVFKIIMQSKAIYASQRTLIKHPLEMVLGFLRETGIPASYARIDDALTNSANGLGQDLLNPPTVFGWYTDKLAGEAFVYSSLNQMSDLMRDTNQWMKVKYTLLNLVKVEDSSLSKAPVVVDRLVRALNLKINDSLKAELVTYLNYDLADCNDTANKKGLCFYDGDKKYYKRDSLYNPTEAADLEPYPAYINKTWYLLQILTSLPDYRIK